MKRKERLFAEHGGTARAIAVAGARIMYPVFLALAVIGSWVWLPISAIAGDYVMAHAAGALGIGATPGKVSPAGKGARPAIGKSQLQAVATRNQGPEYEQTLTWASNTTVSTPTALRTDRKIQFYYLHFRGRLTNGTSPVYRSGPAILNAQGVAGIGGTAGASYSTPLFALFQYVTVRGTHARYGSQTPMYMRGETIAEMMAFYAPNYVPAWTVTNSAGGVNGKYGVISATSAATIDVDFTLPVPLYPLNIAGADIPFFCLHGPDWAGNLYMDVACSDGTVLSSTGGGTPTFTAYGSNSGSPSVEIYSVRPLLTKQGQQIIKPVVTFHYTYYITSVLQSGGGSGALITNLTVGKDTARLWQKYGTTYSGVTSGSIAFGTLSDGIVTRSYPAMDNRPVRFLNPNSVNLIADWTAFQFGRLSYTGYQVIDFIGAAGASSVDNPKAAFPSSTLTADRLWQLQGDITASANQIGEVIQVMLLGTPGLLTP